MAKKRKKNNRNVNNNNGNTNRNNGNAYKEKAELIERLKAEKIEAAIHNDRFEDIVKDYEEFKEELKKNNEEVNLKLQSEFDAKAKELEDKKQQVKLEKANIEKVKEDEISKIKDKQEVIAEQYLNELIEESDEKLVTRKKEIEDSVREYEKRLEVLQKKHESDLKTTKIEVENEYEKHRKRVEEELVDIKEKVKESNLRINEEKASLNKEKMKFERLKEDFDFQKELLKEEKESMEIMKERYSPQKIVKLQLEYEELKRIREVELEQLKEVTDNYTNLKTRLPGSDSELEVIVAENENLKKENSEFADRLAQYPSLQEVNRMREDVKKLESLENDLKSEERRRKESEAKVESIELGSRELEQSRKVARTLTTLNDHLQNEISEINKMYQSSTSAKFQALCEIDEKLVVNEHRKNSINNTTLEKLVEYVRNYGATRENLYYSDKMLQCFFASMASSHMIILQGLSGTGKSSLPRLLGKALNFESELFPVQPSWRDNRELLGYDNDFTKRFKETEFTKFMYKISAPHYDNNINLAVLDEMNLARVEYYFADFLAVLENDMSEWVIPLVPAYDETNESRIPKYLLNRTSLQIKNNTWFVGTVNRDESTFGITNKVYDRAMVIDFNEREESFSGSFVDQMTISFNELNELFLNAIKNPKYSMNEYYMDKIKILDNFLKEKMNITFGNRVENQIKRYVPVFVASGGTKEEAIDYLFAYKVLRQLEDRYEPYLKKGIKELKELISSEFDNSLVESMKLLSKKEEQLGG